MTAKNESKICFVISPIGEEDSDTRKHSDQVLKHIISSAVEQLGYEVIRADKISEPGIITTQIIQHIVDSSLVIADLTERNPNVFYELALRHVTRKPLIQMIKKGEVIPFDVAALRIIQFDLNLDGAEVARREIIAQVQAFEAGKSEIDNPISVSLDLKMLKESGSPEQRSLADLFEAITDLRAAVTTMDKSGFSSKSLEEFKGLLEGLPSKIEHRLDPEFRRKRRKYHHIFFEEFFHLEGMIRDPNLNFLMMISFLKDDFPWIYEIGLETYKELKSRKSKVEKRKSVESFENALEMLGHPFMKEMYGKSEDMYMFSKEIRHFLHHFLNRYLEDAEANEEKP